MKTIDLFCGAGGITEGFRQAGFTCLYANDFNKLAVDTFQSNHPDTRVSCNPIEDLDPRKIRCETGLKKGELDVLVGGPPCQGFSINAPERFVEDPRNSLFRHYLRFLDEFGPKRFLFENVPGMLSLGGGEVFRLILDELARRGYRTTASILLSAHYGVPQTRWRLIILGTADCAEITPPRPSHAYEARANFSGGASMKTRLTPAELATLKNAVTLRQAIGDLPPLSPGGGHEISDYTKEPTSEYSRLMRMGATRLYNHTANRIAPINLERLEHIPPGGNWTNIPHELLPAGMKRARRSDHTMRYGRLTWGSLSGTMLTKCDPHWGAVYHPDQKRTFSVREAARIQSFPDHYRFMGPRVSQYEQVGNAVPVLMAKAIATTIAKSLNKELHVSADC